VRIMPELSARRSIWITVHHDLRNLPRIVALQKYFKELFESDASYLAGETP
jgi:hypothetical protein